MRRYKSIWERAAEFLVFQTPFSSYGELILRASVSSGRPVRSSLPTANRPSRLRP